MRAIVKCDDYASFKLRVNARPHFVNEKQQKHRAIRSGRTMVVWTPISVHKHDANQHTKDCVNHSKQNLSVVKVYLNTTLHGKNYLYRHVNDVPISASWNSSECWKTGAMR